MINNRYKISLNDHIKWLRSYNIYTINIEFIKKTYHFSEKI